MHDFQDSLAFSERHEDADWWERVYREAFPAFATMFSVRYDERYKWAQLAGIDRVVCLANGRSFYVDEKVRSVRYDDILLEQYSDLEQHNPGWMQKELASDYIAYAFTTDGTCYLLPFQGLRRAWLQNGSEWIRMAKANCRGFRVVDAKNRTYTTRSIAVPIPVLMDALLGAMEITVTR